MPEPPYTPPQATGLAIVARIRHAHGDPAGALEAMGEAGQTGLSPQVIPLLNPVPSERVRAAANPGRRPRGRPVDNDGWSQPRRRASLPPRAGISDAGRVLLAQDDPGPALTLLQRLLRAAASQGRAGSVIEIQALRALALAARGDHASALDALTKALTLAPGPAMSGASPTKARRCALCSPSCPPPGRASSTRLAAPSPATRPRSCAPAAGQTPCRRRGDPRPLRRAWPSR